MHALAVTVVSALTESAEKAPKADDVVAGWMGFAVFAFLIVAVALLGWSLTKQLRKADRAKDEGVYGDEPADHDAGDDAGHDAGHDAGTDKR